MIHAAFHAFDRLHQLLVLARQVFGEGQQKGSHLPALRVALHVFAPIRLMRFDGLRQRRETMEKPVVPQLIVKGADADGRAGDGVADVVQDGLDDLHAALGEGAGQGFVGLYALRNVVQNDHAASQNACFILQGPSADADVHACRS